MPASNCLMNKGIRHCILFGSLDKSVPLTSPRTAATQSLKLCRVFYLHVLIIVLDAVEERLSLTCTVGNDVIKS